MTVYCDSLFGSRHSGTSRRLLSEAPLLLGPKVTLYPRGEAERYGTVSNWTMSSHDHVERRDQTKVSLKGGTRVDFFPFTSST